MEALFHLVSCINAHNVAGVFTNLSSDWQTDVRREIAAAPTKNWDDFRILSIATWVNAKLDDVQQHQRKQKAEYRSGVETLRAFLDGNDST
jgi:hypothetical protein